MVDSKEIAAQCMMMLGSQKYSGTADIAPDGTEWKDFVAGFATLLSYEANISLLDVYDRFKPFLRKPNLNPDIIRRVANQSVVYAGYDPENDFWLQLIEEFVAIYGNEEGLTESQVQQRIMAIAKNWDRQQI